MRTSTQKTVVITDVVDLVVELGHHFDLRSQLV